MAVSLREYRARIKSTESMKKITRAMELIAASRIIKAQQRAQAAAPLVPTYWAMRGFRSVAVDGAGLADVALVVGVLTAFTVGFLVVALLRFRVEDTKVSWA